MEKTLAVFASGNGSNFEKIIDYLRNNNRSFRCFLFCNNKSAFVLKRAESLNIKTIVFNKEELKNGVVFSILKKNQIDFIVLSGFLFLIPKEIVSYYNKKIINIHPSLLPMFGGRGMFGKNVHKAVLDSKSRKSGITIHHVNKDYDKGLCVFQKECLVDENDDVNSLSLKIQKLEHLFYPKIIDELFFEK